MQMFWDIVISSSFTTLVLYIWLKTDAFVEYMTVIDFIFSTLTKKRNEMITEYRKLQELSPSLSYPEFLLSENNNFFTKLLNSFGVKLL